MARPTSRPAAIVAFVCAAAFAHETAATPPTGGGDWRLVNDVFAAAVRQQQGGATTPTRVPAAVSVPVPSPTPAPVPRPVRAARPAPEERPSEQAALRPAKSRPLYGWISEIRAGVLKPSVPISTDTPKETGIDGNLEVLFASPGWLDLLWSPRPHLGASFNASSTNTDQLYGGLTWEWKPWGPFFIDASLGFSVHNGRLHNKPGDTDQGRRREFGCVALFRESLELGVIIAERHTVSAMWDHISHGGLCDDENEGMDNAGVRYGYRF